MTCISAVAYVSAFSSSPPSSKMRFNKNIAAAPPPLFAESMYKLVGSAVWPRMCCANASVMSTPPSCLGLTNLPSGPPVCAARMTPTASLTRPIKKKMSV